MVVVVTKCASQEMMARAAQVVIRIYMNCGESLMELC